MKDENHKIQISIYQQKLAFKAGFSEKEMEEKKEVK